RRAGAGTRALPQRPHGAAHGGAPVGDPGSTRRAGSATGVRGRTHQEGPRALPPKNGRELMRVLVTGGAGYAGSGSGERLIGAGHQVIVIDSLVTGHRDEVAPGAELVVDSVIDREGVAKLLTDHRIDAVLHCAARSLVGQSVAEPALYYAENVVGGIALLDAMRDAGVTRLVFSSTAAVYGAPERTPVRESDIPQPVNPYGATKLAIEGAMRWYAAYGLRTIALRYFNVAGASER